MSNKTTKMITEAITDEKKGKRFYQTLADTLELKGDKKMVRAIAKQEGQHKKKLKRLQVKLRGR